jgi:hypothetical protein
VGAGNAAGGDPAAEAVVALAGTGKKEDMGLSREIDHFLAAMPLLDKYPERDIHSYHLMRSSVNIPIGKIFA